MGKKKRKNIHNTCVCQMQKKCVLNSEPHLHRSPIPRSKRIDCVSETLHRKRLMNDRLSLLLLLAVVVVLFLSSLRCMSRISRIEKIMEIAARTLIDQRNAVKLTIVPLILCCRLLWLLLNRATVRLYDTPSPTTAHPSTASGIYVDLVSSYLIYVHVDRSTYIHSCLQ